MDFYNNYFEMILNLFIFLFQLKTRKKTCIFFSYNKHKAQSKRKLKTNKYLKKERRF
jgi:hypothetical protein